MLVLEGLVIVELVLMPASAGVNVVRRYLPATWHQTNFAVAKPIRAILGVIYGLLLGLLVVNLWGELQNAL